MNNCCCRTGATQFIQRWVRSTSRWVSWSSSTSTFTGQHEVASARSSSVVR